MNLQLHLLTRIGLVALVCLLAMASYSLYQSHYLAEKTTQQTAKSLTRQLESQLLLINTGLGQNNPFPDFEVWKQSGSQPGMCLAYASADRTLSRNLCNGIQPIDVYWPTVFETAYRFIFNPGKPLIQSIALNGQLQGFLTITPSAELEIVQAWDKAFDLMMLTGVTVTSVCLLVYLSIRHALNPAKMIVAGIKEIESGNPDFRMPTFELNEWHRIASAINQLAATQGQLLDERQKLAVKLINFQEEERRYLARELHDEFGQCLAAINAVAVSIKQTAALQCPELMAEANHISRITAHILESVHDMLGRLRPIEFDELGLAASLTSMVATWNAHSGGKPRYHLSMSGDAASLTESEAVTLFRIAQECLTNVAKHAAASRVDITLDISQMAAILTVKDNGLANTLPFADAAGFGLLGIRERLSALCGQLTLTIAEPHGLVVEARLPVNAGNRNSTL